MHCLQIVFAGDDVEIGIHHFRNELRESDGVPPTQHAMRFGGIALEHIDFGGPEIAGVENILGWKSPTMAANRVRNVASESNLVGGYFQQVNIWRAYGLRCGHFLTV